MTVFLERGDSRNRKEGFKLVNDHDKIQMYVEGRYGHLECSQKGIL